MATVLSVYNEALRLIGDPVLATTSDDTESRYTLDAAYADAVTHCLALGWWRFAFHTATQTLASTTLPGYARQFTKPSGWLRTHSVGLLVGTNFRQIDWYEESVIAVKYTANVVLKWVKSETTEANWPPLFGKLVSAFLALECCERIAGSQSPPTLKESIAKIFEDRLMSARQSESLPPPLVLPEHAVERTSRNLLEQGFWRFSIKSVSLNSPTTGVALGFAQVFTLPADYLRVYSVDLARASRLYPADFTIQGTKISAQYSAIAFTYVSSDYLDPSTWPENFAQAVESSLIVVSAEAGGNVPADKAEAAKAQLDKILDTALGKERLPRPPNLKPGALDRVIRSTLEMEPWRFATKTAEIVQSGTPSPGYAYAFALPADWMRTIRVYRLIGNSESEISARFENGKLHADYSPIQLRYISTAAVDPADWSDLFAAAVEHGIRYEAALAAEAADTVALFQLWKQACGEARIKDGLNERQRFTSGRFNAARRGAYVNREQGY